MFELGDIVRCNCGCRCEGMIISEKCCNTIRVRWTKKGIGTEEMKISRLIKIGKGNPNNDIIIKEEK